MLKLASVKTTAPKLDAFDGPFTVFLSVNLVVIVRLPRTPNFLATGVGPRLADNCLTGALSNEENQD